MYDYINREQQLANKLYEELYNLRVYLIGNPKESDVSNIKEPTCLQDEIVRNINILEETLKEVEIIKNAIVGGGK